MRPVRIALAVLLAALIPVALHAVKPPSTEATVHKVEGTIMVEHLPGSGEKEKLALQTNAVVSKGDIVTVYDKSWVILRTPKGDLIGLLGPAVAAFDELYKEGPDRQVRVLLKSGQAFIKSKNSGSRQSFFEVHTGPLVSSFGAAKAFLEFDPKDNRVEIRYFGGKLKTLDAQKEHKYYLDSRRVWEKGQITQKDPAPLPLNASLDFKNFFEGKPQF